MNVAKIVVGVIIVEAHYHMGGREVLETRCSSYDSYSDLPDAVEFKGKRYGKTGWNSDSNRAYYKTGVPLATACA